MAPPGTDWYYLAPSGTDQHLRNHMAQVGHHLVHCSQNVKCRNCFRSSPGAGEMRSIWYRKVIALHMANA